MKTEEHEVGCLCGGCVAVLRLDVAVGHDGCGTPLLLFLLSDHINTILRRISQVTVQLVGQTTLTT
jgi:hypothetical protein